jgi:glycosyltransferase involved in cell wall biosynthesis
MSRILILEANPSGHRLVYVRLLVTEALGLGHEVIVGVPKAVCFSNEFAVHLNQFGQSVDYIEIPARLMIKHIKRISEEINSDRIVIPDADLLAPRLAFFGWTGRGLLTMLVMRDPRWESPKAPARWAKLRLKLILLSIAARRPSVRLIWLREPGYRGCAGEYYACDPVILDADRVTISANALQLRKRLGLTSDVFWFGVAGCIDNRKNVPIVLEAIQLIHETGLEAHIGLALLGPLDRDLSWTVDEIEKICKLSRIPLVLDNRVMSNLEMNSAVKALDCVVMAYSTHSPNSTLGKAAALGVRIVAAGSPSIHRFVASVSDAQASLLKVADVSGNMLRALSTSAPKARTDLDARQFCKSLITDAQDGNDLVTSGRST